MMMRRKESSPVAAAIDICDAVIYCVFTYGIHRSPSHILEAYGSVAWGAELRRPTEPERGADGCGCGSLPGRLGRAAGG